MSESENNDISFGVVEEKDLFGNPIETFEEEEEKPKEVIEKIPAEPKEVKKEVTVEEEEDTSEKEIDAFTIGTDEEEEEVVVSEKKITDSDEIDYKAKAEELVELGIWEAFEIEDEGAEINEETFKELKKLQGESRIKKLKESKLTKEEQTYLDFKQNGGNFQAYADALKFKDQAENLDIQTVEGKQNAVYSYYKNIVGWGAEKAAAHVRKSIEDLSIDSEAEFSKSKLEERAADELAKQEQEEADRKDKLSKARKGFETDLKKEAEAYGFKPKKLEQVTKDFEPITEEGLSKVDQRFLEAKSNPKEAAEIWRFLMDKENFIKEFKNKTTTEANQKAFNKITLSKKATNRTTSKSKTDNKKGIRLI